MIRGKNDGDKKMLIFFKTKVLIKDIQILS